MARWIAARRISPSRRRPRGGARSCSPLRSPRRRSRSKACASSSTAGSCAFRSMSPMSALLDWRRCASAGPTPTSGAGARGARSLASAIALWEEAANGGLQPYAAPEILSADLSGLALDCALWGVADPSTLAFLDPPPRAALKEARTLLTAIGAIEGDGRITEEGRAIASLALPPRLARMVVDAARAGDAKAASEIAVVLTERGLGGDAVDLATRVEAFRRDRSQRADDARRLARGLAARAEAALIRPSATFSRGRRARCRLPIARQETGGLPSALRGEGSGVRAQSAPCSPPPSPIASQSPAASAANSSWPTAGRGRWKRIIRWLVSDSSRSAKSPGAPLRRASSWLPRSRSRTSNRSQAARSRPWTN